MSSVREPKTIFISLPLKRIARFSSGGSISSADISETGEYPVFGGNGVRGYTATWNLDGSNLLVGRQGALAGNVHRTDGRIWVSEHALIATLSDNVDRGFAYYLLLQMNLNQYSRAAAQPGIAAGLIEKVPTSVPVSVEIQERIASFLDAKTAEIDGLVEKLERQRELLERYRRELIAHTVTRGLNPDVPMHDSGISWVDSTPKHWEVARVKQVARIRSEAGNPGLPYLGLEDLVSFKGLASYFDIEEAQAVVSPGSLARPGDVVFSKLRVYLAKSMIVSTPTRCTSELIILVPTKIQSRFLGYLLRSVSLIRFLDTASYGAKMPRISPHTLLNTKVPVLPIQEQTQIADFLDKKTSEIDGIRAGIEKQIELLVKYRKQIINDVVTGKVRVCEEDE